MTEQEVAKVLDILNVAYPSAFSRMSNEGKRAQFELWNAMFKQENPEAVVAALYASIEGNRYPPTVADIKARMKPMRPEKPDNDLHHCWKEYVKALQGNRRFDELPEAVRKYLGSNENLQKQQLDESLYKVLYTVEKSNFYKQVQAIISEVEEREYVENLLGTEKVKQIKEEQSGVKRIAGMR